jgi:hypothetical protein
MRYLDVRFSIIVVTLAFACLIWLAAGQLGN